MTDRGNRPARLSSPVETFAGRRVAIAGGPEDHSTGKLPGRLGGSRAASPGA